MVNIMKFDPTDSTKPNASYVFSLINPHIKTERSILIIQNQSDGLIKYARPLGEGTRYTQYKLTIFKDLNTLYISTCGKATADSTIVPNRQ